jgi:RHS repeat-associated protein
VQTNPNGTVSSLFTSNPFGDGYSASSSAKDYDPTHFALLDHDAVSGTDHAQFRQYDTYVGNWMSPDPYLGSYDANTPQTFNRYTYALNQPGSFLDPSGLVRTSWGDYADPGGGGFGFGWDEFALLGIPLYGDPEYVTYGTNVPLGSSSWSDGTGASGTLTSISFWYTPIIGSGFDLLGLLQGPTVGSLLNIMAPNNANQPSWQQKMRQASHFICGKSPGDRVAKSVLTGAGIGAVTGGIGGFVAGEVFGGEVTLGATGFLGAYLGAHVGAAVCAANGLTTGAVLAGICYAGFQYDN